MKKDPNIINIYASPAAPEVKVNKIDNALNELIDFLKGFLRSYLLCFYKLAAVIDDTNKIKPRTLAFLGCFIYAITFPFEQGPFIATGLLEPVTYFKTISNAAETSIIKSFILSIPYFFSIYLVGQIMVRLLASKSDRSTFIKIYYCYAFWQLVTSALFMSLLVLMVAIGHVKEFPEKMKTVLDAVFDTDISNWFAYGYTFGVPVINILIFGKTIAGVSIWKWVKLFTFAVLCLSVTNVGRFLGNSVSAINQQNEVVHEAVPTLFHVENYNGGDSKKSDMTVAELTSDSVRLTLSLVLVNASAKDYYSNVDDMVWVSWTGTRGEKHSISFSLANRLSGEIEKIEPKSIKTIRLTTKISKSEWKADKNSILSIKENDIFKLSMSFNVYEYNPTEGDYDVHGTEFDNNTNKNPTYLRIQGIDKE